MSLIYKILLLLALCFCNADAADPLGNFCNLNTNISRVSQISVNIDRLLAELVSKTSSNGYVATSFGRGNDQVFGLAQCRGDVSSTDCSSCIQDAAKLIRQRCPNQADSRIWYDYCFLRYNNKSFAGEVDTSVGIFYFNVDTVTDPENFNKQLGALMDEIRARAIEPKNEGLGKGDTKLSSLVTLYALVQCTRDLSQIDCAQCLAIAVGNFETICSNRKGCRVLYSSCYVRYELYPFFYPLGSNSTVANNKYETALNMLRAQEIEGKALLGLKGIEEKFGAYRKKGISEEGKNVGCELVGCEACGLASEFKGQSSK